MSSVLSESVDEDEVAASTDPRWRSLRAPPTDAAAAGAALLRRRAAILASKNQYNKGRVVPTCVVAALHDKVIRDDIRLARGGGAAAALPLTTSATKK